VSKGEKPVVDIAGTAFPMPANSAGEDGQAVVYGVRPEHLEIHPDGVEAKISVVEPTGSETLVFVRFGEGEMVALFRERHDFKPGDALKLKPRLAQVHLFDAETGKRL
ncbi:TOBE domain-containing protein, partial [Mesorhizobium sp. M2A.F.Ca.ET.067.02.1.1]|uniref:TOBE domain-containing protein n=1 Tax=Mesorhizobium sp. M2A.F.Ca.ET.067.02.1.1 TaxID=2496749 RepID=UPI000FD27BC7